MYGGLYFKKGLIVGLKKTYLRNDKRRKSKDWFCCLTIIQNYTTAKVILEETLRLAMWRRGITTAYLHSTKPKLRFCAGSNPTSGVSEVCDDENSAC